jgi:hypothetical protein
VNLPWRHKRKFFYSFFRAIRLQQPPWTFGYVPHSAQHNGRDDEQYAKWNAPVTAIVDIASASAY